MRRPRQQRLEGDSGGSEQGEARLEDMTNAQLMVAAKELGCEVSTARHQDEPIDAIQARQERARSDPGDADRPGGPARHRRAGLLAFTPCDDSQGTELTLAAEPAPTVSVVDGAGEEVHAGAADADR